MPRKVNIKATFKALRHLPLVVSYEQVEQWVGASKVLSPPDKKPSWLDRLWHWLSK